MSNTVMKLLAVVFSLANVFLCFSDVCMCVYVVATYSQRVSSPVTVCGRQPVSVQNESVGGSYCSVIDEDHVPMAIKDEDDGDIELPLSSDILLTDITDVIGWDDQEHAESCADSLQSHQSCDLLPTISDAQTVTDVVSDGSLPQSSNRPNPVAAAVAAHRQHSQPQKSE